MNIANLDPRDKRKAKAFKYQCPIFLDSYIEEQIYHDKDRMSEEISK